MADVVSDEPRTLASLPTELLMLVAGKFDMHSLACFAAASTVCLAAALNELRAALVAAVKRCLVVPGGRISNALAACPYFHLPDDLVALPERAFVDCTSLTKLTLPAALATIGDSAFEGCTSLTQLTLPAALATISDSAFEGCTSLSNASREAIATIVLCPHLQQL